MKITSETVAIVTGAGGGLGRALCKELADKGANIALVDISDEALGKTVDHLDGPPGNITTHIVDVTDRKQMSKLADDVVSQHGQANLLINNAGITLQKSFSTHSLEDWDRIVGINLWGVVHGLHFFDEHLKAAKDAHVVNLSSMSAFVGLPAQSSYCATKAAVELLSTSLWAEWGTHGIGVTHVHPGAIQTDMILATLDDSDDIEAAKKNYDIAMKMGIDADKAAAKIIKAVERNKKKIRIGKEAYIFDYMSRFLPRLTNFATRKIAEKQLEGRMEEKL